jgi:outer membrane autotransporter protein
LAGHAAHPTTRETTDKTFEGVIAMQQIRPHNPVPLVLVTAALGAFAAPTQARSPIEGELQANTETTPQRILAATVEEICPPGNLLTADLQARCNEIAVNSLSGADIPSANNGLQAMAPEENSAVQNTSIGMASDQQNNVGARLAALRNGIRGASLKGLTFNLDGRQFTGEDLLGSADRPQGGGASADFDDLGAWGFFLNGHFGWGDKDATDRESGFEFDRYNLTAGVDYRFSATTVAGIALGYSNSDSELDLDGGELDQEGYSVHLYGSFLPSDTTYVDVTLGAGTASNDQLRRIRYSIPSITDNSVTVVDQSASASPDSDFLDATIAAGLELGSGAFSYGPHARFSYRKVDVDAFRESMSNPGAAGSGLGLFIDSQKFTSKTFTLGMRASNAYSTSWGVLVPQAGIEWTHEFDDGAESINGYLLGDSTQTYFFLPTDAVDSDYFVVDLGVSAVFTDGRSAFINYSGLLGYNNLDSHQISAGVRFEF